ncbi:MAG: uroporphyrinogen decarboxylase family protein [Spirochaetaceae bacterium]|jgi:uroporphyrinogen decarboxylase|nr:uroporphyrinogen decarboxylase family protein [Spirochaetaceae bacterium]
MTAKEVILNAIAMKPVERVPFALFLGGSWALGTQNLSFEAALKRPVKEIAAIIVKAYRASGSDIVWAAPGSGNLIVRALGGKLKFRQAGPPDVVEPVIKNPEMLGSIDIEQFKKDAMLRRTMEITKYILKETAPYFATGGSMWGPLTLAGLLYGTEPLMRDMRRNKQAVHAILDWTARLYLAYVETYINDGMDIIAMGEPSASGDIISRQHFSEFVLPALKNIYRALSGRGVKTCLHICGNVENRLDLMYETGVDVISVDYKVSLKKARDVFSGRLAFAGNVDPVAVLQDGTADEIKQSCCRCIEDAGTSGFILMPGCDISPSTPLENIKTMMDAARSYPCTMRTQNTTEYELL